MISRTLIFVILLLGSIVIQAQNQYRTNHYIANQGLLNPAYNGTRDIISGLILHRSQWLGFEGAPMNQALNVHGPVEDTNIGVGISVMNDNLGFHNTFDFMGAGSYKLQIDRDRFVTLGLQLGFSSVVYDGTKAITEQYGDPVNMRKESKFYFNTGFGAYFYATDYFAGFSIPKFFSDNFDERDGQFRNKVDFKNMHMYLYGGYVFDWYPVKVKPTLLLKEVYGAPMQFDVTVNVLLNEQIWVGLSYRTVSETALLLEYIINRQFTVRYAFDYSFTPITQYAKAGSHEIGIQYDFSFNKRPGMRSIRYF